jgi:hypothetical protein
MEREREDEYPGISLGLTQEANVITGQRERERERAGSYRINCNNIGTPSAISIILNKLHLRQYNNCNNCNNFDIIACYLNNMYLLLLLEHLLLHCLDRLVQLLELLFHYLSLLDLLIHLSLRM